MLEKRTEGWLIPPNELIKLFEKGVLLASDNILEVAIVKIFFFINPEVFYFCM
jgi:hypothetical protein